MAEMTAEQALSTLGSLHIVGPYDLSGVIEVIEKQAQEIERMNACLQYEQHRTGRQGTHADGCYKWGPGHWDCAVQEIERLQAENEGLKCCGNCKHQTYDGMDYGCEVVLKNYHQNKCDKWHGVK